MKTQLKEGERAMTLDGSLEEILAGLIYIRMSKTMAAATPSRAIMRAGEISRGIVMCEEEARKRVAELVG